MKPFPEGLFKGDYGPHGVELIHVQLPATGIKGLKGIKVTGDPNVPFDKITFEVDEERCLNMPKDAQQSCNSIIQFHQDPQYVDFQVGEIISKARFKRKLYQEGLRLPFRLPDHCHGTENFPDTLTNCMVSFCDPFYFERALCSGGNNILHVRLGNYSKYLLYWEVF